MYEPGFFDMRYGKPYLLDPQWYEVPECGDQNGPKEESQNIFINLYIH